MIDYDRLNNNYSNKINEIKEELIKLQNTNSKLDEFSTSVNFKFR